MRTNIDLARVMFAGYPAFVEKHRGTPGRGATTKSLHAMPRLRSPDDRLTAITRLRFVMEDPTQLLSNSVAHFVIDQLCEHNNRPELVVIPGFSKVSYPTQGGNGPCLKMTLARRVPATAYPHMSFMAICL